MYTVGSTTKRQADGTEKEEARAYLDVDLGGLLDLVPWGLFWVGSDDGRPPTSSRLTESRTGKMTRGGEWTGVTYPV